MTSATRTTTRSAQETAESGRTLASVVRPGDVILLSGDLGAGKTQFAKGLAEGLGVSEPVTSPTFNILLVHQGRMPLYHFDLYRLERAEELEDLDYFGTLESDGVSVVEWGDRFPQAAPRDGVDVVIRIIGDEERVLDFLPLGSRGEQIIAEWCEAREPGGSR